MATKKTKSESLKKQPVTQKKGNRRYDLDFLRVCAIIAVIIVHCVSFSTAFGRQETNHLSWLGAITIDSFVRWCVPVFVMISGALIINDKAFVTPGAFLKKRLLRLLPALVAWPLIYEIWTSFLQHRGFGFTELIKGYAMGSFVAGSQLYFLFLIAGLYLLTPFISAYVHLVTRKQLWVSVVSIMTATTVWYTVSTITSGYEPPLNFIVQGLPYVGYFILGYLLKDAIVDNWLFPVGGFLAASIAIDITLGLTQQSSLHNFFFSYPTALVMISSPLAFLSGKAVYEKLTSRFSEDITSRLQSTITKLSGSAFGVYLIHLIILDIFVLKLDIDRYSLKGSLVLIPLVAISSWLIVFTILRIPYIKELVK